MLYRISSALLIASLANTSVVVRAAEPPGGSQAVLRAFPELQRAADRTQCSRELDQTINSDLLLRPAEPGPLRNAAFQRLGRGLGPGMFYGTSTEAVDLLVARPHAKLLGLTTRAELDRAWGAVNDVLGHATQDRRDDKPYSVQWMNFAAAAYAFHNCFVRSEYAVDFRAEAKAKKDADSAKRAAEVAAMLPIPEEFATPSAGGLALACRVGGSAFPADFESGDIHFLFRDDLSPDDFRTGRAFAFGFKRASIDMEAAFSWVENGDGRKRMVFLPSLKSSLHVSEQDRYRAKVVKERRQTPSNVAADAPRADLMAAVFDEKSFRGKRYVVWDLILTRGIRPGHFEGKLSEGSFLLEGGKMEAQFRGAENLLCLSR